METRKKGELTKFLLVIDNLMVWLFPLLYALGAAVLFRYYLVD